MTFNTGENKEGVLCLNPGSSSLKWAFFTSLEAGSAAHSGQISQIEDARQLAGLVADYPAALAVIRFVHGGNDFISPVEINADTLTALQALESLAPLHNRASLHCSRLLAQGAPALRQIAVFDTEFFHALPPVAQMYGLPRELAGKYGIRRFGFHGFAHDAMAKAWKKLHTAGGQGRLVTIQLGSGCSMVALKDGRPVDTSMGFSPNEGLLMSTRSGDMDPGLLTWLQRREGWSPAQTDRVLNEQSGWLGVSGESANMADLLASGSDEAAEAVALMIHRLQKTLGAYYALIGPLDGIVISGGVAERALPLCRRIFSGLEHLGIALAPAETEAGLSNVNGINVYNFTLPESGTACWCVQGNEHRSMLDSVAGSSIG